MDKKQQVAKFSDAIERAFSRKTERIDDQVDFNDKYQHLLKDEYDTAVKIVVSIKDGGVLVQLMNAYLSLYGRYAVNKNNIHFYRSDQVFQLLIEQSAVVSDESLFETWDGLLTGAPDDANSFKHRFADLSATAKSQIDAFRKKEREKRRNRRSVLDLLKDEYARQRGHKPGTNEELYDLDPRPGVTQTLLEEQIMTVRKAWNAVTADYTKEKTQGLDKALAGFNDYLRSQRKKDLLFLFQAIRQLQQLLQNQTETRTNPKTGKTETHSTVGDVHERVLFHGLYAIACTQLMAAAQADKLFARNRNGFTAEELAYFYHPVERSNFFYRSNIRRVLSPPFKSQDIAFGQVRGFLGTYALAKAHLPGLDLVQLDKTLEIQNKWREVSDLTDLVRLASKRNDVARLNEIFADPRNQQAIASLKEITSTQIETKNPQELGKATLAAGSRVGGHNRYGDINIVFIDPKDNNQIYVELGTLRPQLFLAHQKFIDDKFYADQILEIYKSTVGALYIVEAVFIALGFLPVLIESGFAGLIYEIAVFYASSEIEEQASKINPVFGKVLGLLIQTFAPRPNFKPKIKAEVAERADTTGLSNVLNFPGRDKSLLDRSVSAETRGLAPVTEAELDALVSKISVEDTTVTNHSGLPLRGKDIQGYLEKFGRSRFPREWRQRIAESGPLRKMIKAAEKVQLQRLTAKQLKAPHFGFQLNSMGSEYELHITLRGKLRKLDGIIVDGNGKSWIGESKFTYIDAFDAEPMQSLLIEGKGGARSSRHYEFLEEEVLPQFETYTELAKEFGFEGVAIHVNTDFLWATFEQTTRYLEKVEIALREFEREFETATRAAGKAKAASRAVRGR